ncbi:RNA polymerase sigma factor [Salinibacterium sp. TMP30]|uniref:RNA polymerase sigma factor n=1 Tax=Salinibacterium sp. TMP30 TaxID=3138237 RepID=UPI00313A2830
MTPTDEKGATGLREDVADGILAERAIDGDVAAFDLLCRRHVPMMRAYVARMLRSISDADDVVQDSLLLAWRQLPTLRDPTSVRAWLMKIASRQALTHVRRRAADHALPEWEIALPRETEPENFAIRHAQLRALSTALDTLSDDQRQCWLLREIAELSYEQIADELEISPSAVRGKLARARASVYTQMEGWR